MWLGLGSIRIYNVVVAVGWVQKKKYLFVEIWKGHDMMEFKNVFFLTY